MSARNEHFFSTQDVWSLVCDFLSQSELLAVFKSSKQLADHVATTFLDEFMRGARIFDLSAAKGEKSDVTPFNMLVMPHPDAARFGVCAPDWSEGGDDAEDEIPAQQFLLPRWSAVSINVAFLLRWSHAYPTLQELATSYCNRHTRVVIIPQALLQLDQIVPSLNKLGDKRRSGRKTAGGAVKQPREGQTSLVGAQELTIRQSCGMTSPPESDVVLRRLLCFKPETELPTLALHFLGNVYVVFAHVAKKEDESSFDKLPDFLNAMFFFRQPPTTTKTTCSDDVEDERTVLFRLPSETLIDEILRDSPNFAAYPRGSFAPGFFATAVMLASFLQSEHGSSRDIDLQDTALEAQDCVHWVTVEQFKGNAKGETKFAARVPQPLKFRKGTRRDRLKEINGDDYRVQGEEELDPFSYIQVANRGEPLVPRYNSFVTSCAHLSNARQLLVRVDLSSSSWAAETRVIPDNFLTHCWNLKHLSLQGLTSAVTIGSDFLRDCRYLEYLDLSPLVSLELIGDCFLANCHSLRHFVLPSRCRVRWIGDKFLSGCLALYKFDPGCLPYVERIGADAFRDNKSLRALDFTNMGVRNRRIIRTTSSSASPSGSNPVDPNLGLVCVGSYFVARCTLLSTLVGLERVLNLPSNTELPKSLLASCGVQFVDTSNWKVGDKVGSRVPADFLCGCHDLREINLTGLANAKKIGHLFLQNCHMLGTIDLSPFGNVVSIGSCFLSNCTSLTSLDLSPLRSLELVDDEFLADCHSLTSVNLTCPRLRRIGKECFKRCTSLSSLDLNGLPALKSIGPAFCPMCRSLESVDCEKIAVVDETSLTRACVVTVGANAFEGCSALVKSKSKLGTLSSLLP